MGIPLQRKVEPALRQPRFERLCADDVHVGLINQLINRNARIHEIFGLEPIQLVLDRSDVQRRTCVDAHRSVDDGWRSLGTLTVCVDVFVDQIDHGVLIGSAVDHRGGIIVSAL